MISIMKTHPLMRVFSSSLIYLPSPTSISSFWNFGSLLGMCLGIQIITGLFLAMHYVSDVSMAFESVSHISRDVSNGWLLRIAHANGASLFFMFIYLHIGRNLYYGSFNFVETWNLGVLLLLSTMATAFFGYVLPWGQMSFWGATVITNLFSALPLAGHDLVQWIWGGFAVDQATLTRFFAFHFVLPFIITGLSATHLLMLHQSGSNNPLGVSLNQDKIMFHPYFSLKDLLGVLFTISVFGILLTFFPWVLGDPENFIPANPLVTPVHIQPEWYFLFAYAILRSIPNKLGGVAALAMSVLVLFILPHLNQPKFRGFSFYFLNKIYFWFFIVIFFLLTWIGARPVEHPYVILGQVFTVMYFFYLLSFPALSKMWDSSLT